MTLYPPLHFVDFIDVSTIFDAAILKKAAHFRQNGHSLTEISQLTGIPKTSLHRLLAHLPKAMNPTFSAPKKQLNGSTPYGYARLKGISVEDPKEQKVIQIILTHWQSGAGFKAIAETLNRQKHVTKMNKPWTYFAIRSVINRCLSKTKKPKETS